MSSQIEIEKELNTSKGSNQYPFVSFANTLFRYFSIVNGYGSAME
jgi:hypothetical protein